jgi:hypothetical protein
LLKALLKRRNKQGLSLVIENKRDIEKETETQNSHGATEYTHPAMSGGHVTGEHSSLSVGGTNARVVSSSIVGDGEESGSGLQKTEKDPRKMARK